MSDLRDFLQRKIDAGDIINTSTAASLASVPMATVHKAIKDKTLPSVKIGDHAGSDEYLIVFEDLVTWTDRRRQTWIDEAKRLTQPRRKGKGVAAERP